MTDTSVAAPSFAEREFRVGSVISAAITVLSRNLLPFCIVTAIANLPYVLLFNDGGVIRNPAAVLWNFAGFALFVAWSAVNQAILLYAAFEDMRGRPVDLIASFGHAWRRFFPLVGTTFLITLQLLLSFLLVVPGFILWTMWFVAIPACLVEQTGPWKSLSRSAALTKGNRWKIFGMVVVLIIISGISMPLINGLQAAAGTTIGLLANLIWQAFVGVVSAVLGVVTYHDLRVANEGVDTDRAAVFE